MNKRELLFYKALVEQFESKGIEVLELVGDVDKGRLEDISTYLATVYLSSLYDSYGKSERKNADLVVAAHKVADKLIDRFNPSKIVVRVISDGRDVLLLIPIVKKMYVDSIMSRFAGSLRKAK